MESKDTLELGSSVFASTDNIISPLPRYLPAERRYCLLGVLILANIVDVMSSAAFLVFTGEISRDLTIAAEQQSWVVTAYTAPFAALLLFWGRVSDLYSPRTVFVYGFFAFSIFSLVVSFLGDQYSFLVFRAFTGVAGSALIPSAYRLISIIFPVEERGRAYTLYGMTGGIANIASVIVAGLISSIHGSGQGQNWRQFPRLMDALALPGAISGLCLIPRTVDDTSEYKAGAKWRKFDIVGVFMMLSSILLIIVGLTLGASYGWLTPFFLVPIMIGLPLLSFFFLWEYYLGENALLPPSLWEIPNMVTLITFALVILGWWATNFMPFIELFSLVHGESLLLAAIRILPEGIAAISISTVLLIWPQVISRPRWPIAVSMTLAAGALLLWTQATSIVGRGYWIFVFPGNGLWVSCVGVMKAAPPDKAGVVGATLQTAMHTSTVIALSIQAGLLTTHPGGIHNYANVKASWYFELGWVVLWLIGFMVFYKPGRNDTKQEIASAVV